MIYDRLKELCKKNGISINALEEKIGASKGSLCKIDKHKPNSYKLNLLAENLHTTVDYLITGKEPEISDDMVLEEIELLDMYRKLKDDEKQSVINLMKLFTREG